MLSRDQSAAEATRLMMLFAENTGVTSGRPPRRYLWTDAFAVCNFLGLARAAGHGRAGDGYTALAVRLVDQVHHVLGRYRDDDPRAGAGYLSGLTGPDGESHPTRGGLRIGKRLPERPAGEPFDERLEWDRDGQYFHYLTKWMHALDQVSRVTREPRFNLWARELADTAHRAFVYGRAGRDRLRMVWKMSTDLSRPLVAAMGQHDPIDGLITYRQLQTTALMLPSMPAGPDLSQAVADFATMTVGGDWLTLDALGLGGLMMDACRTEQLMHFGAFAGGELLDTLLEVALEGLPHYARQTDLRQPASNRLAFRELGLAIGLHAIEHCGRSPDKVRASARLEILTRYASLGAAIETFWLDPEHQRARSWTEHRDINEVMLATSLVPEGVLIMPPAESHQARGSQRP
jgi:hypothetical protein